MCAAYIKKAVSVVSRIYTNTNPVFMGQACILLKPPSDDISLCLYLVEHNYLSAFYKTIIIVMIKKQYVVLMVLLFECVV